MPGKEDLNTDNQPKEWMNVLPEDMRTDKNLLKFNDVSALAKSYGELSKMVGNSVRLPGEESTAEEISSFYSKLGRPESIDGYELDKFELPEGLELTEDQVKSIKQVGFDNGLSGKQMKAVYDTINQNRLNDYNRHMETLKNASVQVKQDLEKEWGDQAEANTEVMNRAIKHFAGDEDLNKFLNITGAGSSPQLLKMFHQIGQAMSEDRFITGDSKKSSSDFTQFDYPGFE